MSDYPIGTVATATVRGVEGVRVMAGYGTAEPRLRWLTTDKRLVDPDNEGWFFAYDVTDIRPLVVLDLKDSGFVDEGQGVGPVLVHYLRESATGASRWVAAAIEAQTRPPKPPEPQGLGAVVEDGRGVRWVRTESAKGCTNPWQASLHAAEPDTIRSLAYAEIDAVRVLSEGVKP